MVFPLKLSLNATEEMATLSTYPNFRFFMTARDTSPVPLWNLRSNSSTGGCDSNPSGIAGCNRWWNATDAAASGFIADFSAVCFMTVRDVARLHVGQRPVALVQSAWGGTRVEAWMSTRAINAASKSVLPSSPSQSPVLPPTRSGHNNASVLYNAMVAPWSKFAVRAALWYQGEANADQKVSTADAARGVTQTLYYSTYLQEMIADWRLEKEMGDFAYLVVSLPPSVAAGTPPAKQANTGRPEIRIAELSAGPHAGGKTDISGVAVTIDLGGKSAWGYDHPCNKNEISRRLALQTLHAAYALQQGAVGGPGSLWTGPVLSSATSSPTSVVLEFEEWSAPGLTLQNVTAVNIDGTRNDCTRCCALAPPFDVLDVHGNWTMVPAEDVRVWHDKSAGAWKVTLSGMGAGMQAVRYAWTDFVECVLVNNQSLPLAPFVRNLTTPTAAAVDGPAVVEGAVAVNVAVAVHQTTVAPTYPAARPPMGFNSWNFFHCNIDEVTVRAIIDAIVTNGMKEAGYEYVNIDDCWQVQRHANGTIQPDPVRFPSGMKALADYAHSRGLKFGVYTARGSRTCQNRPGAYAHETLDAQTYCDWGLDYLKNDNCGGKNWPQMNKSWSLFQDGFDACYKRTGRYIVKSIEYCRDVDGCGKWIGGVANLWRTVNDVQATWTSVMSNIHANDKMAPAVNGGQAVRNGQGNFNDADMLEVGNVGLTVTEQYSMMSLWSIAGSPLLAATDLLHPSETTLRILANKEVTAINQDLGWHGKVQGVLVKSGSTNDDKGEVWCKPLADGQGFAVVLLNLDDDVARNVTAAFSELGLPTKSTAAVRDLWAHNDLPAATGLLTASVEPHGTRMFKLTLKKLVEV